MLYPPSVPISRMCRALQSRGKHLQQLPIVGDTLIAGSPAATLVRRASSRTGSASSSWPPRYESTAAHKSLFIDAQSSSRHLGTVAPWLPPEVGTLAP